ncbi:hypothetical protein RchiOBHm_Chr6g0266431 [Rosa chinensis]|uniref:Uncharacterized protein n=1 Tax=Rosa chinensis TaxID=74649 RepID=A0A2P6PPN8_ROSCH|nr:hypothetical protein RchiOBHm_Chr6g0266431 [Rosa chinensis]
MRRQISFMKSVISLINLVILPHHLPLSLTTLLLTSGKFTIYIGLLTQLILLLWDFFFLLVFQNKNLERRQDLYI